MAAFDFNGDQRNDLVVLGAKTNPGAVGIYVYSQLSDGALATPELVAVQTGCDISGAKAGDLNGDGRADHVVSHICGVEVLSQTANGRLVTTASIAVPPLGVSQMAVLRGAGRASIVALPVLLSGPTFVGAPQVWRQDLAGQFASPVTVPSVLRELYRLSVADINGDGLDDLILWGVLSKATAYGVELILQRSDGSFGPSTEVAVTYCGGANGVAAGDINGDGRVDLVLIGNTCTGQGRLEVLLQDSSGAFQMSAPQNSAVNLSTIGIADIDADGRLDIVTIHDSYGVGVYLQRSDGSMSPEVLYDMPDTGRGLVIGEVTGDGRLDIVTSSGVLRQKPTLAGASAASPGARRAGLTRWLPRPEGLATIPLR